MFMPIRVRRGCQSNDQHSKRELRFFATQIAGHFHFAPDWHRKGKVAELVRVYYRLLRSILKADPDLRPCLVRCWHCRILFLVHPRNVGRCHLRCPFGCREAHRKQQSILRSVAYYKDEIGRRKKQIQNGKRRAPVPPADPRKDAPLPRPTNPTPSPGPGPGHGPHIQAAPTLPCPRPILNHVRIVATLIEGRRVSLGEVLEMLAEKMRQHRMGRRGKFCQFIATLHEPENKPP